MKEGDVVVLRSFNRVCFNIHEYVKVGTVVKIEKTIRNIDGLIVAISAIDGSNDLWWAYEGDFRYATERERFLYLTYGSIIPGEQNG